MPQRPEVPTVWHFGTLRSPPMDPILAAQRLPRLAERAMRHVIVVGSLRPERGARRFGPRVLADDALVCFERLALRSSPGVRPALLFSERNRIVAEVQAFLRSRLAARLFAVRPRDIVALGKPAAPFDALIRGRRGGIYGVVLRRLARDGRRLETIRAIRRAARSNRIAGLRGVLVYDFATASVRTLRCGVSTIELSAA